MDADSAVVKEARRPGTAIALLILLAGSLLVGFSQGRWLAPLAAWIGPVLILRYARDHSTWRGFLLVLLGQILAVFLGFGDFFPLPMAAFIVLANAFLMSLPYLADRLLSPRLPGFSSTLAFPLAATALEFMTIHVNPMGTWGSTGFTQYGVLPIMQLASVTGMIGITFLMGWFVSVANWVWEHGGRVGETRRGLAIFGSVFLLVLAFGYARLSLAPIPATGATVRVAGITAQGLDAIGELMTAQDDASLTSPAAQVVLEDHWNAYFRETAREAAAGAKVIMWPEVSAVAVATDEESRVAQAQEVARQNGIYLALPMATVDPETQMFLENKVILIDPSGQIAFEHIKFGGAILESTRVGDGVLQSVDTPYGVLSAAICYDADYPTVIRQTGWNGVGLLLVPSRDWLAIDPVHTHMAVFRAVENGMSLVRQTDRGLSIAVDPYGRVLAQTDFFGATDRTLVAQVPAEHVTTAYTLGGVWLEWLAPLGFLGIAVWVVARRRRAGG